jgi:hypothetical protein
MPVEEESHPTDNHDKPTNFGNVQFGACQKPCSFANLEGPLYSNVRKKLSALLHSGGFSASIHEPLCFTPEDKVCLNCLIQY